MSIWRCLNIWMGKVFALETFNCLTKGEFYCSARMPTSRFSPEKVRFYRTKHFGSILDKKRETYNAMFGSLKENLESRGLELSARYKDTWCQILSWQSGTHSSLTSLMLRLKVVHSIILLRSSRNGFRGQFSDPKCTAFRGFIRSMIGIVNVPPLWLISCLVATDQLVNCHFRPSTRMIYDHNIIPTIRAKVCTL